MGNPLLSAYDGHMNASFGSSELAALTGEYIAHLRMQLVDAEAIAQAKQHEAAIAREYVTKIKVAIQSAEALQADHDVIIQLPQARDITAAEQELLDHFMLPGADGGVDIPAPLKLQPYVPAGGKRLKSKRMLFDLMKMTQEPLTRDQLRAFFFSYYGMEDLKRYWVRPENALNTAIDRAVADGYILVSKTEGAEDLYHLGWQDESGGPAMENGEDDD